MAAFAVARDHRIPLQDASVRALSEAGRGELDTARKA